MVMVVNSKNALWPWWQGPDGEQLPQSLPESVRLSRQLLEKEVRDRRAEALPDRSPNRARSSIWPAVLEAKLRRALQKLLAVKSKLKLSQNIPGPR